MKPTALVLVILGTAALIFGVIDYSNSRTTIEVGSMSASVTESGSRWMFALIGGSIAVLAGLALSSKGRSQSL
jgi:hypothetical protein